MLIFVCLFCFIVLSWLHGSYECEMWWKGAACFSEIFHRGGQSATAPLCSSFSFSSINPFIWPVTHTRSHSSPSLAPFERTFLMLPPILKCIRFPYYHTDWLPPNANAPHNLICVADVAHNFYGCKTTFFPFRFVSFRFGFVEIWFHVEVEKCVRKRMRKCER